MLQPARFYIPKRTRSNKAYLTLLLPVAKVRIGQNVVTLLENG